MPRSQSVAVLLAIGLAASSVAACDALRAARGCGDVPLDPGVTAPVLSPSAAPINAEARERRAREVMATRSGLSLDDVRVDGAVAEPHPEAGITVYGFKVYRSDGTYLGPVFLDASGTALSENAIQLADVIAGVRARGKVGDDLSDAVARAFPSDVVPVMFQLVTPAWDGPPRPWPTGLGGDEWNAFVERHADAFYRPVVAPFVEHLRSIGARDIDPDPATGAQVKEAWVFARVPSERVCAVARRREVLRALYNPPASLN